MLREIATAAVFLLVLALHCPNRVVSEDSRRVGRDYGSLGIFRCSAFIFGVRHTKMTVGSLSGWQILYKEVHCTLPWTRFDVDISRVV